MATLETLRAQGWHLSTEGFNKLCENDTLRDIKSVVRKALDVDLRDIGSPVITTELSKDVFGPVVLQILKLRNISASKAKQNSQTAPRMLKLSLTDGHNNCQAIEIKNIPALNLDSTVPGTKLLIDGAQIIGGCLAIDLKCCKVLGGNVPALVERWEVSKLMPSHIRVTEDGPPAWVNFGKKIITNLTNVGFKSLENKNKENSKENAEFQNQRQDAISEAAQGAVKKVFGGGVKTPQNFASSEYNNLNTNNHNVTNRASNKPTRNKVREKPEVEKVEKPSQRVSLFDFLEDKLPATETSKPMTPNVKIYNNNRNFETEKEPYNKNKFQNRTDNKNTGNKYNYENKQYENRYQPKTDQRDPDSRYQKFTNDRKPYEPRPNERYQNEKPPRFQKQKIENVNFVQKPYEPKAENSNQRYQNPKENRSKPDTNNFVNKLANEINNISLYNTKYENEKLNKPNTEVTNNTWKWKTGDRCMAKYWEDNKFYNAVVTGVTNRTCMVEFLEYGNFEEVLHCDCIPITSDKDDQQIQKTSTDNQRITGNLEFRRGKNRPFIRNQNKTFQSNRNYES